MGSDKRKFLDELETSFKNKTFVKLTFGKKRRKSQELKNIYARLVKIKDSEKLLFTYRYATNDEVKNYEITEVNSLIEKYLGTDFMRAHLFTTTVDAELSINKKGKEFLRTSAPTFKKNLVLEHDHKKVRFVDSKSLYLHKLEITDKEGKVRPKKQDKFKQINKYIELLDSLLSSYKESDHLKIVDMGSGKGYLTFALYDYLNNSKGFSVEVLGVEQRKELVDFCNKLATECKFKSLKFKQGSINDTKLKDADVLIALHACDTATDDAIAMGIKLGAKVIVCAPCCHKQIRVQMSETKVDIPQLKYGILMERQAEMITDTIRALIMEQYGYDSRIFEFISSEHTGKNLMIAGIKTRNKVDTENIQNRISGLKKQYGIKQHHLEILLRNN